jgi:hypothetical protein
LADYVDASIMLSLRRCGLGELAPKGHLGG